MQRSAARGVGSPIALHHYDVLGEFFPEWLRRILDIPAYWLIFLTIEFPAIYPAGLIAFAAILRSKIDADTRNVVLALAALTAASLMTAWLLVSTLATNNDLGWRAVLPAVMVLTVIHRGRPGALDRGARKTRGCIGNGRAGRSPSRMACSTCATTRSGRPNSSGAAFSQQASFWARVRAHAAPDERVANNTLGVPGHDALGR